MREKWRYFPRGCDQIWIVCSKWVSGAELSSAIYSLIHNSLRVAQMIQTEQGVAGMQSMPSLPLSACFLRSPTPWVKRRIMFSKRCPLMYFDNTCQRSHFQTLYWQFPLPNLWKLTRPEDSVKGANMWVKVEQNILSDWLNRVCGNPGTAEKTA